MLKGSNPFVPVVLADFTVARLAGSPGPANYISLFLFHFHTSATILADNKMYAKSTKVMKYLDLSFATPAMNLACDEALLELCENGEADDALLRIWEPQSHFVVLGHANRLRSEVNRAACAENRISILRRLSGGGAVMQGPGCLNYCLILNGHDHRLRNINDTFRYVLERHRRLIGQMAGVDVWIEGVNELPVGGG